MDLKARFENFIKKANEIWDSKYDYSKVNYINSKTAICIICPEHGEFWITPKQHLDGRGCTLCAKNGKWTTEKFIQKAKQKHGNKYDYSKSEYISAHEKICIICPEHGEFWQSATAHVRGQGCPKCVNKFIEQDNILLTEWNIEKTNNFIKEYKNKWGNKYDYSKVRLNTYKDKICIICPEHGEFWQMAQVHKKSECPKCANRLIGSYCKITFDEFINRANKIHGNKYTYVKDTYIGFRKHMTIICPIHGEFKQTPVSHIAGAKCPHCGKESMINKLSLDNEEFIKRAKLIHNNKYDYSKVEYVNLEKKVTIICPIHGEFQQQPSVHLNTKGCPKCKSSKLELEIMSLLEDNNIYYEYQSKPLFLKDFNYHYHFDFYLPQQNIVIECQGLQHFNPVDFSGRNYERAKKDFNKTIQRDKNKYQLCKDHGIKILYYTNVDINISEYIDTIYNDKSLLLEEIQKNI